MRLSPNLRYKNVVVQLSSWPAVYDWIYFRRGRNGRDSIARMVWVEDIYLPAVRLRNTRGG